MLYHEAIRVVGEGWVAEEALAISAYCSLLTKSFEQGVAVAVNHNGDSDSTGAITGNLLGVIPNRLLVPLELKSVLETIASDLWSCRGWHSNMDDDFYWDRYPGA